MNTVDTNKMIIKEEEITLEKYFEKFRKSIIGQELSLHQNSDTSSRIVYADWTASGRLYRPIEEFLSYEIGPYIANTHTETSFTGSVMTYAYHNARDLIKSHIGAGDDDVLICCGAGMTGAVNKLQRILGLKIHEKYESQLPALPDADRPLVLISHMEHHSNQTSWIETVADVVIVPPNDQGLFSIKNLESILEQYRDRKLKIAAITSCSNVTGIFNPYYQIAEIMHDHNGYCFVDFACSAPYVDINMRPTNPAQRLDAVYFSPHKFLGGPGTPGVLAFNSELYDNKVPDNPGGGTVLWTNPWGDHEYLNEIELREDGGTPAFIQTIKAAKAIQLKEEMSVEKILEREHQLNNIIWERLSSISNIGILAEEHKDRLGIFSFTVQDAHYNLIVKLLCDRFGVQTRGGCACAGTYGHYLLGIDQNFSHQIIKNLSENCQKDKPGWIRMSIHPTMTTEEVEYITESIADVAKNWASYQMDFQYDPSKNIFHNHSIKAKELAASWF